MGHILAFVQQVLSVMSVCQSGLALHPFLSLVIGGILNRLCASKRIGVEKCYCNVWGTLLCVKRFIVYRLGHCHKVNINGIGLRNRVMG